MTVIAFPGGHVTDIETAVPTCVVGGRRTHPAEPGTYLCQHHLEELGTWLRDIEDETLRLSAVPRMETVYDVGGSSLASERAPANLEVIAANDDRTTRVGRRHVGPVCAHWSCRHVTCWDIRSDRDEFEAWNARARSDRDAGSRPPSIMPILATLHGWAQQVRDERKFAPPHGDIITPLRGPFGIVGEWRQSVPVPPTIMSERDLLTRQLGWIATRDWVDDFRREIGDLRRLLLRLNRNEDPEPLPGYCYRLVDGEECGGDLWPAEPIHSSGYETKSGLRAVVCARNADHRWEDDDLPRLTLILDQQRAKEAVS